MNKENNNKIDQVLDSICAFIKYKQVHQDIRDELTIHITELKDKFLEKTQNEETALDMAISSMGDCNEIGRQLNERHKPETEWALIGLTAIIAVVGGITMYTSSLFESSQAVNFERYLFFAIQGFAIMTGIYFFDYTKLKRLAWPIYLFSLALIPAILIFGEEVNGRRFFIINGSLISTEFITLLFLVSFAGFVDKARGKGGWAVFKLSILASISVLPIIMHPRLSQALTLLIVYLILTISAIMKRYFGGSRKRQFIFLAALACSYVSLFAVFCLSSHYRFQFILERITSFTTRIATGKFDLLGVGYQQAMADKWLKASSLFGGAAERVNGYGLDMGMPGVTTDYVLINVIASHGWAIGIILVLSIAVFIGRMFITTKKIKNEYGFYLSLAACTVLAVQFIAGILVNFNLLPSVSVYIPLLSYGGVGYITSMALIGLVLSVRRRNNLIPASPKSGFDGAARIVKMADGKLIVDLQEIIVKNGTNPTNLS